MLAAKRSAKTPIPAASRRGITEISLRDALPPYCLALQSFGECTQTRLNLVEVKLSSVNSLIAHDFSRPTMYCNETIV